MNVRRSMPSLNALLAAHARLLVLDAASSRVQIGWLDRGQPARWFASEAEAGVAVFEGVKSLGRSPEEADALVFCEGPGSVLGVRTTAMAIRTWTTLRPRPVFTFQSLAVVAHVLRRPELTLIADARRDTWHAMKLGGTLQRIPTAELGGVLAMPEYFRNWTALPRGVERVPYSLEDCFPRVADDNLFRATDAPDAFLHEEPSYVTWTPQIHRAPSS